MKRTLYFIVSLVLVSALFHSCGPEDVLDETLLYGKWKSGTEYWVYKSNYTGYTWDGKDDVEEDEADPFKWQLVKSELRQLHINNGSFTIPKNYTVTELSATTLKYKNANRSYSFTKVN